MIKTHQVSSSLLLEKSLSSVHYLLKDKRKSKNKRMKKKNLIFYPEKFKREADTALLSLIDVTLKTQIFNGSKLTMD